MAALKIIRNADRTITISTGNYQETISTTDKSMMQLIDEIRWVAITGGVTVDEQVIWEKIQEGE